jgi:hypothetical protein
MFFGQCVPHDGVTVMPYSVDAGVEEIIGLDGIRPVREWYGYAFGLPDRHPTGLFLWRGSMPMRGGRSWVAGRIVWRVVV